MEPHGQARGPIQPPVWGDIPVKRWRIPPPEISFGEPPAAGMRFPFGIKCKKEALVTRRELFFLASLFGPSLSLFDHLAHTGLEGL
jgi:hypothetical protein